MTYPVNPPEPGRHHLGPHHYPMSPPRHATAQQRPPGHAEPLVSPHHDQQPAYRPPLQGEWADPAPPSWGPPRARSWAEPPPPHGMPTVTEPPPPPPLTAAEALAAESAKTPAWPGRGRSAEEREDSWIDVRRQIAHRVRQVNAAHSYNGFEWYHTKLALSPHAVVLLFVTDDATETVGYRIPFLVRMFLAGPESEDLAQILADLTRSVEFNIARATEQQRRWHPRGPKDSIVNNGEMDMPDDAVFVGVGVSSLNTDQIGWHQAVRALHNQDGVARQRTVFDLAGRCIVRLTDGTMMKVDRDPLRRIGDTGLTSNRNLDPARMFYWNPRQEALLRGDPVLQKAWAQLEILHNTLHVYLNNGPRR